MSLQPSHECHYFAILLLPESDTFPDLPRFLKLNELFCVDRISVAVPFEIFIRKLGLARSGRPCSDEVPAVQTEIAQVKSADTLDREYRRFKAASLII